MVKVSLLLLLSFGIFASVLPHGGYNCAHDSVFKGRVPQIVDVEGKPSNTARRLQEMDPDIGLRPNATVGGSGGGNVPDGRHRFRITVDFSESNAFIDRNPSLGSVYEISVRQIDSVRRYFERFLEAANAPPTMNFQGGRCFESNVAPFNLQTDLYVIISPLNDPSTSFFAAATSCFLSSRDSRPVVGAYILNFAFLQNNALFDFIYFSTFAHEFTHILGFSDSLFNFYVVPGTTRRRGRNGVISPITIGSETFNGIILPEVITFARAFYNCPTLQAVPLENNGGSGSAGSHWEKLFLPLEFMNPTVENPGILSPFTFNLLQGSGWYQVDMSAAQFYDIGQGSGCDHFRFCPAGSGYCDARLAGQTVCSISFTARGVCNIDTRFSSGCALQRPQQHSCLVRGVFTPMAGEVYGPGSRCFNYRDGSRSTGLCQPAECTADGIMIRVGGSNILCRPQDSGLRRDVGLSASLECPNFNEFCAEFNQKCPMDCNAKGLCLVGRTCFCYTGSSGADCTSNDPMDFGNLTNGGFTGANAYLYQGVLSSIAIMVSLYNF